MATDTGEQVPARNVSGQELCPRCGGHNRPPEKDYCIICEHALRSDPTLPEHFICLVTSPDNYICNLAPKHDGPHQARVTSSGDYGRIVKEWGATDGR